MLSIPRLSQSVALAASAIGLFCACGLGYRNNSPPPPPLPKISLSSDTLAFDPQVIGTQSPAQQIVVTNNDVVPLSFDNLQDSTRGRYFKVDATPCLTALEPGHSCIITVIFQPQTSNYTSQYMHLHIAGHGFLTVRLHSKGIPAPEAPRPPSP